MNITKNELEKLYRQHSNLECCKILGVTQPTLLKYLALAGIEKKGVKKITIVQEGK